MNRTLSLTAAAALLVAFAPAAHAQQVDVEELVLDNGMKFLLVPRKEQVNSVSAGWVAKVGSVDERPGITGLSHFFEHMMFKGSQTIGTKDWAQEEALIEQEHAVRGELRKLVLEVQYPRWKKGEIDDPWDAKHDTEAMKGLRAKLRELTAKHQQLIVKNQFDEIYTKMGGTGMNAFTSHDLTFYFIKVPSNKFELWTWMESERLLNPVFREFYAERDVVHEERRMRTDSTPTGVYDEQFDTLFWQSSPYSWPVIGWPTDLANYTPEQASAYFSTYYRPNNLVGVIVGDFDVARTKALLKQYFGRLQRGPEAPSVVTLEVEQLAERRLSAEVDAAPQVEVRYHSVPFGHPDEFALEIMAELLNGRTGRLYRALVEEQQLASGASVRQDSRRLAGAFSFRGEAKGDVDPAKLEAGWYAELKRLQDAQVPAEELQKVKNQVLADSFRRLKDDFFLMVQLGYYEALGGWEYINQAPDALLAVTPADIQRVAKQYFTEQNRSVATYTRKAGATPEDPALAALEPQLKAMVKQALGQLEQVEDPAQLRAQLQAMEAQKGQVPPQVKPALEYLISKIQARLAALEGGE